MPYTYMVLCADGTYYTGWTTDLQQRVKTHNDGNRSSLYTLSTAGTFGLLGGTTKP